jgi:formylglycine-generating enzyme required for sulfatase activity/uncharacterized caspase-like protein
MAKNWAIVIGINDYRFLQPLKYAKRDAEIINEFLSQNAGFDRIFLFTDNSPPIGDKPTEPFRANVLRVFRQIFSQPFMQDGDNFWFFFSGHGIRHQEQDYLMPLDGDPEDVVSTGIPTHTITNYLRSCGADNVVMILDACRSGGKKSGQGIGKQTEAEARQTGVISIFSCSPEQYSYEIEVIEQGAFTYALLEGLGIRGRCATVERLNQYLTHRVPELVSQHLGRARQIPYTIAEPLDRSHLILMPQHASLVDIATLKNDAYRAQTINQDWDLAQRLWIRVLAAASGQDMDAIQALQAIAISRQSRRIPEPSQPAIDSTPTLPKSSDNRPDSSTDDEDDKQISIPSLPDPDEIFTNGLDGFQAITGVDLSGPQLITPEQVGKAEAYAHQMKRAAENAKKFYKAATDVSAYSASLKGLGSPSDPNTLPTSNPSLLTFSFETITVNAQGKETSRRPGQAEYFVEDLGNGITLEMVKIPGGSFKMGSPMTEKDRADRESPQHTVTVPSFFIGKFTITQAQYQQLMGTNPADFKGKKRPVECVSWNDAVEFCTKLSKQTEQTYRLPSEAEWEYACRAGTTIPFYFGETLTSALANYNARYVYQSQPKGEYRGQTTEVGIFPPNAFGLYDMHGNVWEWCQDYWHDNYEGAPSDGSAWVDPDADEDTEYVLRGGSWLTFPGFCRSAYRTFHSPDYQYNVVGFRVVCVAP